MSRIDRIVAADEPRYPASARRWPSRRPVASGLGRVVDRMGAVLRSMLGQMILATALFVGFGVYIFAIVPILSMPPLTKPDPMEATVGALNARLQSELALADSAAGALARASHDPLVRQVTRRNPAFRYVFVGEDGIAGTGPLRYFHVLGLDRFDRARRSVESPGLCAQLQRSVQDDDGNGYAAYSNCGRLHYVEFRGVRVPVDVPLPTPLQAYARWLWSYSRDFLMPTLGIFLLLVAVLFVNVVRIRRVARLTSSLGPGVPDRMLPEGGLPGEVVPLVRAVNRMTARIEEAQRGQRFFLSAAAHELRTPLTVLRMRLEIMDDCDLKARLVRDLSRLTALSNNLLTLMSIERRERRFKPVDLARSCVAAMRGLGAIAREKDVTLRFIDVDDGPVVLGDAALIEVAITNLVENAISFAPPQTEVIVALDGAGSVTVRDAGPGLPVDLRGALFEPFVRGRERRPGHGLGLAIVRAVADLHGATVSAEDAAGGGARFAMTFPRIPPADVPASLRTA